MASLVKGDFIKQTIRGNILNLADKYQRCLCQVMPIFAELADNPNPFFNERLKEPLLDDEDTNREEQLCQRKSRRVKRMDEIVIISMTLCLICYCLVRCTFLCFFQMHIRYDFCWLAGYCNPET